MKNISVTCQFINWQRIIKNIGHKHCLGNKCTYITLTNKRNLTSTKNEHNNKVISPRRVIFTWLVVTGGKLGFLFGSYQFVKECWDSKDDPDITLKDIAKSFVDCVGVYSLAGLTWPIWTSFCFLLPFWADAKFKREAREEKVMVEQMRIWNEEAALAKEEEEMKATDTKVEVKELDENIKL